MSHTGFTFKVHRCTDIDASKYEVMPSSPTTETIVEVIFLNTSRIFTGSRTQTRGREVILQSNLTRLGSHLFILIRSMEVLIHCVEKFMCFVLYKVPKIQVVYRLPSPTTLRLIGNIIMLPFDFLIYIRLDICTMKIMIATRRKKHIAMAPLIIHEYSQNSVSDQKMFEFESCLPISFFLFLRKHTNEHCACAWI